MRSVPVVFDVHNSLQMDPDTYAWLDYVTPFGKTMFQEYEAFFERLSHLSQVGLLLGLLRAVQN